MMPRHVDADNSRLQKRADISDGGLRRRNGRKHMSSMNLRNLSQATTMVTMMRMRTIIVLAVQFLLLAMTTYIPKIITEVHGYNPSIASTIKHRNGGTRRRTLNSCRTTTQINSSLISRENTPTTSTPTTLSSTKTKDTRSIDKIKQRFMDWSNHRQQELDGVDPEKASHREKILFIDGNNVRGMNKFEWDMIDLHSAVKQFCFIYNIQRVVVVWDHGNHPSVYTQRYSYSRESNCSNNNVACSDLDMVVLFSGLTQRADDVLVKESKNILQQFYLAKNDSDNHGEKVEGDYYDWSSFAFVTSDRELSYKIQHQAISSSTPQTQPSSSRFHAMHTSYDPQSTSLVRRTMPLICDSVRFVSLLKHHQQHNQPDWSQRDRQDEDFVLAQAIQRAQNSINSLLSPNILDPKSIAAGRRRRQQRGRRHKRGGGEKTWQRCILAESLRRAYDNRRRVNFEIMMPSLSDPRVKRKSAFLDLYETMLESSKGFTVLGTKPLSQSMLPMYDEVFGPSRLDKNQHRLLQSYNKFMAENSSTLSSSTQSQEQEKLEDSKDNLLILGLGRVGLEIAQMALESGHFDSVVGTVRSQGQETSERSNVGFNLVEHKSKSIHRIPFDPTCISDFLQQCSHVLFTIPLSSEPCPDMQSVLEMIREWYRSCDETRPKWLGLLSTTGVYGNHDGGWVTEDSLLLCDENSNAYLYKLLEDEWIQLSIKYYQQNYDEDSLCSPKVCIFRCAGIYDSTRSALHTVYKQGYRPITQQGSSISITNESKTNRIHSFDLARSVVRSMLHSGANTSRDGDNQAPYRVYNLADDLPEARSAVLDYAYKILLEYGMVGGSDDQEYEGGAIDNDSKSDLAGLATGTVSSTALPTNSSKRRLSRRQTERKMVSNERMKLELLSGFSNSNDGLQYPTYREGLRAIFLDPSTPWQMHAGTDFKCSKKDAD